MEEDLQNNSTEEDSWRNFFKITKGKIALTVFLSFGLGFILFSLSWGVCDPFFSPSGFTLFLCNFMKHFGNFVYLGFMFIFRIFFIGYHPLEKGAGLAVLLGVIFQVLYFYLLSCLVTNFFQAFRRKNKFLRPLLVLVIILLVVFSCTFIFKLSEQRYREASLERMERETQERMLMRERFEECLDGKYGPYSTEDYYLYCDEWFEDRVWVTQLRQSEIEKGIRPAA
jgi:apolipoprotein N-acyltransferase